MQSRLLLRHLELNLRRIKQVRCDASDTKFQLIGMQADRQVTSVTARFDT